MKTVRTNFKLRDLPLLGKMVMFLLIGFLAFGGDVFAESCSFHWNSSPVEENILGYKFYYGTTSKYDSGFVCYDRVIDIGNVTSYTVNDLDGEVASIWYFAITAYNQYGESDYSDELSCDISYQPGNELPEAKIFTDVTTGEAPLYVSFDGSESTDTDGAVIEYYWDFGNGENENGAVVDHTYLEVGDYIVTLTVTDNEGATDQAQVIISVKEAESEPVNMMINFQPASASVPDGYSVDSGQSYKETIGYGWTQAPASIGTRDRNNSLSPDQAHDTMIHVAPAAVWEAAIQNGTYTVTVCTGDPSYPTGSQNIQVEGLSVIENESLSRSNRWIEADITVDVMDSRLTLIFDGSDPRARLCWIQIVGDDSENPGNELPEAKIFTDITTGEAPLYVSFDGSESTDTDGAVIEYHWDFGDGENGNGAVVDHTYLEVGDYIVALTVIDNEGATDQAQVIISVKETESKPVNMVRINFQPASAPVPDGYSVDSGHSYKETIGYGWTQAPASLGTRDRNNSLSPDQAHDTMIHVVPTAVWEAAIQDGTYTVTVCAGDPSYPSDSQSIQIEGLTFIEDESLNSSQRWIERTATVTVSDGRLTVTFEGSDLRARLCFITVSSY